MGCKIINSSCADSHEAAVVNRELVLYDGITIMRLELFEFTWIMSDSVCEYFEHMMRYEKALYAGRPTATESFPWNSSWSDHIV